MKKTLAMLLAVLVALSMFSVAAFAEGDTVTVYFNWINENGEEVNLGKADLTKGAIDSIAPYIPENPTKASDGKYTYTFKGWMIKGGSEDELYYKSTIKTPGVDFEGDEITYIAVFSAEKIKSTQTFWNFIESIFERINLIFQYFATIFGFDAE